MRCARHLWFNLGFLQTPSSLFVSVPVSCCPVFLVLLCQGPGTIFMCGLSWGMGSQVLLAFILDFARAGPWAGMRNKLPFQGQNTGGGWLTLAEGARQKKKISMMTRVMLCFGYHPVDLQALYTAEDRQGSSCEELAPW